MGRGAPADARPRPRASRQARSTGRRSAPGTRFLARFAQPPEEGLTSCHDERHARKAAPPTHARKEFSPRDTIGQSNQSASDSWPIGLNASPPARSGDRRPAPTARARRRDSGESGRGWPAGASYGTGRLYTRTDRNGRETWYGKWHANGRRVNRKVGSKRAAGGRDGLTRAQAEAELRRLMAEVQVTTVVAETLTVAAAGARYQRHLSRAGRKRSTVAAVESALRVHLVPFFAEKALDAIRHEDVVDLVAVLEQRGLGPKSIHNYVGTLSALFNFAKAPQRRWAAANPCEGVELPGVHDSGEIRFLDEAEWEAVLRHVQTGDYAAVDRTFYVTAVMAGLRHGELIALRWRDVDWVAGRVRVRQNHVLGEFDTPKSRRGSRSVPMADRLAGELDRLYKALGGPDDDALVFPDPTLAGPSTRRRTCAATARCSEPQRWTRRITCTGCVTPSGHAWPPRGCRCGCCRSGWDIATSRPPSATRTTRRASMSPISWSGLGLPMAAKVPFKVPF